jgi:hypothetical protein
MNYRTKLAPVIVGALITGTAVVEGGEPEHIEHRQHEEVLPLTYEVAPYTVTVTGLWMKRMFGSRL